MHWHSTLNHYQGLYLPTLVRKAAEQLFGRPLLNELEASLAELGDLWNLPPPATFARFVATAARAMLANVGLKRPEYEALFFSQPETVQTQLDMTFKFLVEAMNAKPFCDVLGELYAKRSSTERKGQGSFFTPPGVANFMGMWAVAGAAPDEPFNLLEPSAGSGGLVLAAADMFVRQGRDLKKLRMVAYDADLTACYCMYVNTTLWEIPCLVRHGSFEGDVFEHWPNLWLLEALDDEGTGSEPGL